MDLLIALAALSIAVGAMAQAVTGMGFALVAAPALMALLGPRDGVIIVVLLGALAGLLPLSREWRSVRVKDAGILLLPILVATPVFAMAMAGVDTAVVSAAAGVGVITGVLLLARGASWSWFRGVPGAIAAGVASTALNVVGGVGGPPIGMYAANNDWGPSQSRATLQFVFLVQNLITAIAVGVLAPASWMVVALFAGTVLGMAIVARVPARAARLAVLLVAGFGGASLVLASV